MSKPFFERMPFDNIYSFIIVVVVPAILGTMAGTIFSKNNNMNIGKLSDKARSTIQKYMIILAIILASPLGVSILAIPLMMLYG